MEFILVFVLSFFVLFAVAIAFALGRPPAYRPARADIAKLLLDVIDNRATIERWEMFLSLPINHDPELEEIREQCLLIAQGNEYSPPSGEGLEGAIFDRRGMARIKEVANKLEVLIKSEGVSRFF